MSWGKPIYPPDATHRVTVRATPHQIATWAQGYRIYMKGKDFAAFLAWAGDFAIAFLRAEEDLMKQKTPGRRRSKRLGTGGRCTTRYESRLVHRPGYGEAVPSVEARRRCRRACFRGDVACGSGRPPPGRAPAGGAAHPSGVASLRDLHRQPARPGGDPGLRSGLYPLRLLRGTDQRADRYNDFYTLVFIPQGRIIATLRSAAQCRTLAAELARVWVRWGGEEPAEDPAPLLQRFQREDV